MAWSKSLGAATAKAGANDVSVRFHVASGAVVATITIDSDSAIGSRSDTIGRTLNELVGGGVLTAGEKTGLVSVLTKLRDAGLVALGYVQS